MTAIATQRDHLLTTPAEDRVDVSRPPSRDGFWKYLLDWCEAAVLVPFVVLATVGVGIALVFVVRLMVEAVSGVAGRIW